MLSIGTGFATPVSQIALKRLREAGKDCPARASTTKDLAIKIAITKTCKNALFLDSFCFPIHEN
eukprot:4000000-Karenia_brevis.AAC.1